MIYEDGDLICTGWIKGKRYEIKRATNGFCGSIKDYYCGCTFFDKGECVDLGGWPMCNNHQVYFTKIEEV